MTMSMQMLQMKSVPKGGVHLLSSEYVTFDNWTCYAEGQNDGIAFKIEGKGDSPASAVQDAWDKWAKLTGRMPELIGALPPPEPSAPTDYQDADHMMEPVDDDIPF